MTACGNSAGKGGAGALIAAVAGLAAGLAVLSAPAAAQPLQLRPIAPAAQENATTPDPTAEPDRGTPPSTPVAEEDDEALPLRPMAEVEVDALDAPDADAVGVLDERTGGLGVTMWDGSSAASVARILPMLPARTYSRPARELMRRLLLSTAAAPEGGAEGLLAMRVERLMAMGAVEDALALLEAVPQPAMTPELLRGQLDALLLLGREQDACAAADGALRDHDGAYWARLGVFCALLAGRGGEAELGLSLLREMGDQDVAFVTLAEAALDLPVPELDSLPEPSPLHLALLRLTQRPVPPDAVRQAPAAVLRAVALGLPATPDVRLAAAEEAERIGAIPPRALARVYALVRPRDDERTATAADLIARGNARARALLYQAAREAREPGALLDRVADGMKAGREARRPLQAARLYAPLVADVTPGPALAGQAGLAARVLLMAGREDAARPWAELAIDAGDPGLQAVLMMASGGDGEGGVPLLEPGDAQQLADWLAQRGDAAGVLLLTLADALDYELPETTWLAFLEKPTVAPAVAPTPVVWQRLDHVAADLRLGETIALALLALDGVEPAAVSPLTLRRVMASLRLVGLEREVRALAVEAALAHGV